MEKLRDCRELTYTMCCNITVSSCALSEDLCPKVVTNARVRLQEAVRQNGGHIEHVLH